MPSFCILSMFSLILCSLNCSYPEFSFCTTFPSFSLVFRALFARAITVLLASDYVWLSLSVSVSLSEFWAKWESSDRKKRRHAWWWWWIYGPMKGPTFGGLSFVFHFFQSFHKTLVGGICYFAFAGSQYGVVYYSWDLTNIFLYSFFFLDSKIYKNRKRKSILNKTQERHKFGGRV